MAATATARKAAAPARAPRPKPRRALRSRPRPRAVPAQRFQPAAAAALIPHAAVRSVGAVRDLSDSSLIMRLTRGRGWIAVLCALLGGIVALNVISLSLNAGAGRVGMAIDQLKSENSALRAEIAERLSASRVEDAAASLGLANPDPKEISYLSAKDGDAEKLANLLETDSFLTEPSQPSSYPTGGVTYAPVEVSSGPSSSGTATTAPTVSPAPSSGTTSSSGSSTSSGTSSGSTSGSTGGVGL